MTSSPNIALVGKLGHGKTHLLNNLCGKHFPSHMGARSCTRTVQFGLTKRHGIAVIDTPGFCASDDIPAHIAAQKVALEGVPLSGIYVVVKYARADEIAEMVENVMDFVGDDDLRIIITHGDTVCDQEGYSENDMKKSLSDLLDIPGRHVAIVGKDSKQASIETFIHSTLHTPKEFSISEDQIALIASLSKGSRKLTKKIDQLYAKMEAAKRECFKVTEGGKSYETDVAVAAIQNVTTNVVRDTKHEVFHKAYELPEKEQDIVYSKAGPALSLRLVKFIDSTNKCLSWDVTDVSDHRNIYKKCNYCGAIFNKTSGCNGETRCGAVPKDTRRARPSFAAQFKDVETGWVIQYFLEGSEIVGHRVRSSLAEFYREAVEWGGNKNHVKREGAIFDSGCGNVINWSTMLPVDSDTIKLLGEIERERPEFFEEVSQVKFNERVNRHESRNKQLLKDIV